MATNASFSPMSPQTQYPQPLQQQQQLGENNGALPAYLQQNQNAANPTPNDIPGMTGMPGMAPESKLGNDQGQQQISLPQQANSDSFTFNKKEAASPQAPAFGKKEKKDKKDAKFGEDEKKEFAKAPSKSPFASAPSFGDDEKKEKE